jgi:uncharacterized protein (TIGR02722 family)
MHTPIRLLALLPVMALVGLTGCNTTTVVDTDNDRGPAVMGLDYRDFERGAQEAISTMISSGAVDNPDGDRYVLVISRIINDTQQRIDTDQLVKKIRVELLNSGKVFTSTGTGLTGPEDEMVQRARELRDSDEINQENVARKGQIMAPDLSLSGKIIQRNLRINSRRQQVEYYLQLTLTHLETGLAIWEGETPIIKRGSNRGPAW